MSQFKGTFEQSVDLITKGIKAQYKERIFDKLKTDLEAELEKIATDVTSDVVLKVAEYYQVEYDKVNVVINFGDKHA